MSQDEVKEEEDEAEAEEEKEEKKKLDEVAEALETLKRDEVDRNHSPTQRRADLHKRFNGKVQNGDLGEFNDEDIVLFEKSQAIASAKLVSDECR